ncbi:aminotransferase class V-fold PLP-dependent enzyme [Pseudoalteromonas tunicata]|uniref:aminotransferase class V-fold PLP-dependent enzyme n=1 Tax=Pseudoalteromonas tunicata TaxID=314281 RepID=UPI00273D823E|nr:aminotransferase class V-fold PLP-dependent enzyme [Pseudoalteromonas tunicata]MDP4983930.1 aminotransferase class V-fold PLP-dependent enzyme [Pseudoalteromonas tunicata]MDP5212210.1 aminotransferase class V-fold PLP-dependent enzyme [Pseudoalteromonas tunicata]
MSYKKEFILADGIYLLSHSVGRPLLNCHDVLQQTFLDPWQQSNREPWPDWLAVISEFQTALAHLFHAQAEDFCPQANLSSALTKILGSLAQLQQANTTVLLSEDDFPSMAFAFQHALHQQANIRFMPKQTDLTQFDNWLPYLTDDLDAVFICHAYSNTGQVAPINEIVAKTKAMGIISIIDCAQSAGVVPLDISHTDADFVIGSSVKWLCGGPGAAFLWVNPKREAQCQPKDVGWFSHQDPFEFNSHHFSYHSSALKFWGGTPSILPYAIAANSIGYFAKLSAKKIQSHNQALLLPLINAFTQYCVSPTELLLASGTCILNFANKQENILTALRKNNISVDVRKYGIRISPHIYNDETQIDQLIGIIKQNL